MPESFTLDFEYKGIPQKINCNLRVSPYTYQFLCTTDHAEIIIEKDDEGNLRALDSDPFSKKPVKTDPTLIRAMIHALEKILQE
jgi:hypothetical protein